MISPVVSNGMYVILGASGNTSSIIADSLLLKGEKVRVMRRDAGRLRRFVLPPVKSREAQERESDAIAKAVKESGLRYAVHLSSYGAQVRKAPGQSQGRILRNKN